MYIVYYLAISNILILNAKKLYIRILYSSRGVVIVIAVLVVGYLIRYLLIEYYTNTIT